MFTCRGTACRVRLPRSLYFVSSMDPFGLEGDMSDAYGMHHVSPAYSPPTVGDCQSMVSDRKLAEEEGFEPPSESPR